MVANDGSRWRGTATLGAGLFVTAVMGGQFGQVLFACSYRLVEVAEYEVLPYSV